MTATVPLVVPAKAIRAHVVRRRAEDAGNVRVVCFTCGHAADELRRVGLDVLEIGPRGALLPGKWWTVGEIARVWPDRFDATSGHLPVPMMAELADALASHIGRLDTGTAYAVPTGSGETITALRLAFPLVKFVAVYDDSDPATAFDARAPLVALVARCGDVERRGV